jgi:hypothetical protein
VNRVRAAQPVAYPLAHRKTDKKGFGADARADATANKLWMPPKLAMQYARPCLIAQFTRRLERIEQLLTLKAKLGVQRKAMAVLAEDAEVSSPLMVFRPLIAIHL